MNRFLRKASLLTLAPLALGVFLIGSPAHADSTWPASPDAPVRPFDSTWP